MLIIQGWNGIQRWKAYIPIADAKYWMISTKSPNDEIAIPFCERDNAAINMNNSLLLPTVHTISTMNLYKIIAHITHVAMPVGHNNF